MGSFYLVIKGKGIHHNGRPEDADAIGTEAVRALLKAGAQLEHAFLDLVDAEGALLEGQRTDLLSPVYDELLAGAKPPEPTVPLEVPAGSPAPDGVLVEGVGLVETGSSASPAGAGDASTNAEG